MGAQQSSGAGAPPGGGGDDKDAKKVGLNESIKSVI